jgi:putative nucleotidyltransferase with HDIG domain
MQIALSSIGGNKLMRSEGKMDIAVQEVWIQFLINLTRYIDKQVSFTGKHSAQVAFWTRSTARVLKQDEETAKTLFWAAMLHDVGKIGVPENVLSKAGPLSDSEWTIMRMHPILGANIVKSTKVFDMVAPVIFHHQEKYDGSGYPLGLKGTEIPLGSRILAVADAYAAMTSHRVYRLALGPKEARQELSRNRGTHFDPQVVEAFLEVAKVQRSEFEILHFPPQ